MHIHSFARELAYRNGKKDEEAMLDIIKNTEAEKFIQKHRISKVSDQKSTSNPKMDMMNSFLDANIHNKDRVVQNDRVNNEKSTSNNLTKQAAGFGQSTPTKGVNPIAVV